MGGVRASPFAARVGFVAAEKKLLKKNVWDENTIIRKILH